MITADSIKRFSPKAKPDIIAALVAGWPDMIRAQINTPLRLAHFLAQLATETGGFTIYTENMNYSAKRLCEVWPTHFRSIDEAKPYANNPEKLANYIYADENRSKAYRLGNTQPGDGWKYRGRGLIQTTGRDGYRRVGHENDPDALDDPSAGLAAALNEWVRSGCNVLADADQLDLIRRRINGGLIGIADARIWLAKAKQIFTDMSPAVGPVPPPPDIEPLPPKIMPASPTPGATAAAGTVVIATASQVFGLEWWQTGLVVAISAALLYSAVHYWWKSRK